MKKYNLAHFSSFLKNPHRLMVWARLYRQNHHRLMVFALLILMWFSCSLSEVVSAKTLTGSWKNTTSLNFDTISLWFSCFLSEVVSSKTLTGSWKNTTSLSLSVSVFSVCLSLTASVCLSLSVCLIAILSQAHGFWKTLTGSWFFQHPHRLTVFEKPSQAHAF